MDLLTAALACSLHHDEALVRALVSVQSEGQQFFVGDFAEMKGNGNAKSIDEAKVLVTQVQGKRHPVGVGLLGIPLEWVVALERDEDDAWDGCGNIAIGTTKLAAFDYQCRGSQVTAWRKGAARRPPALTSAANRTCVLRKFANALALPSAFLAAVFKELYSRTEPEGPIPGKRQQAAAGVEDQGWEK
jgi:hypothetical protein